jgi:antitoxin component of RelBE/YafQ-DinJ toxin-antitoxin module
MKAKKKVFIQFQCDESTRQKAHKVAAHRLLSVSDVLRLGIEKDYAELPRKAR